MLVKSFFKIDFQQQSVIDLFPLLNPEILLKFNILKGTGLSAVPPLFLNILLQDLREENLHKTAIVQELFPGNIKTVLVFLFSI
jgi:hypothetical protein